MNDSPVCLAQDLVAQALATDVRPVVRKFFDPEISTTTHVVHDPASRRAAIIDPILDFDLENTGYDLTQSQQWKMRRRCFTAAPFFRMRLRDQAT